MDETDARILDAIQADFPLAPDPYDLLGKRLGIGGADVFAHVRRMAEVDTIRRLGPRFDSRRLGFVGTLVAVRLPGEEVERAAEAINRYPEVTHNYQRNDEYNLWFTLIARDRSRCDRIIAELRAALDLQAGDLLDLPAERTFKLNVRFLSQSHNSRAAQVAPQPACEPTATSIEQRRLLAILHGGLPLAAKPYATVARRLGMDIKALLGVLRKMLADGRIRSMGAIANQRHLGYAANVMIAWDVADEAVEPVGKAFASIEGISHCYQRPRRSGWRYNLYTMLHATDQREADRLIEKMAAAEGVDGHRALPTVREFKKTAPVYG